ncbi:hypothetical protein DFH07DRAFT_822948 [Mycena maculata]|uniref:Uncharacterized protein n=1 Tax=Mycena maculata TaxID=230809 RepID=A0AAD7J444_9AGAR|nr:hypothetical protein DFH07DRAFT_822948 [Mycena maculata]
MGPRSVTRDCLHDVRVLDCLTYLSKRFSLQASPLESPTVSVSIARGGYSLTCWALPAMPTIIVDDQSGDPTTKQAVVYSPPGAWTLGGIAGCVNCALPSSNLAYESTFHGSFFNLTSQSLVMPTATVNFFGTSVSVVCILADRSTDPSAESNMVFNIDGEQKGAFSYNTGLGSEFQPNTTVFSSDNLPLGNHTLTIQNGIPGSGPSIVMLDSIIYSGGDEGVVLNTASASHVSSSISQSTTSSQFAPVQTSGSLPNPSQSSRTGVIVGSVLSVCLIIGLVVVFFWLRHRHRRNRDPEYAAEPENPSAFSRMDSTDDIPPTAGTSRPSEKTDRSTLRREYLQQELRAVREKIMDVDDLERQMLSDGVRGRLLRLVPPRSGSTVRRNLQDATAQLDESRARNEQLAARIRELEGQMQSAWALGLSDDPPPGYSDDLTARVREENDVSVPPARSDRIA